MGLGGAAVVSLDSARLAALAARELLAKGIDPIDQRRAKRDAEHKQEAARITFATVADNYIAAHEAAWRNAKHRQQWRNSIATYVNPIIGRHSVSEIDVNMVLRVLQPIWAEKTETATRVRSRIELILEYATARGWRSGPNPATWRNETAASRAHQDTDGRAPRGNRLARDAGIHAGVTRARRHARSGS